MFQDPKETFNFMLSLAEQMLKNGNREHGCRHSAGIWLSSIECPVVTARAWTPF